MNSRALAVLEFDRVLESVARRAGTKPGSERIRALRPGVDPKLVRRELERVEEARDLGLSAPGWSPPGFPDATQVLRTLSAEGGYLTPVQLSTTLSLLASSRELSVALGQEVEPQGARPHLADVRDRLPVYPDLEAELSRIVDSDGAVRDGASRTLRSLRKRLRDHRAATVRQLEAYMRSLPEAHCVEGASVSVRDGHFVIPIRREGRSPVGGVVRGESATGATLFVEPPLAMQLSGEAAELEHEEAKEVRRILTKATDRLRRISGELDRGFDAQVDFDSLWARGSAAQAWEAVVPEILDMGRDEMKIEGGRHPLLVEQAQSAGGPEVVPFSFELEPEERAVVISGPNTGGKTVLLKSIGLIHLLAQSGVVPPVAAGSRLAVMGEVYADIGDEQSIAESLSTFSAHMENARELLSDAGPQTLVLIDEMGTGTDPKEGAALARAMLEALVDAGARVFVTSHLGALKRLDGEGSGIVNASLLFDLEQLRPTYRFLKGRPGRSFGLAVASRLGLPDGVLRRAEEYVGSAELDVEALLETLQRKEHELDEALDEARAARKEATELLEGTVAERERVEARAAALEGEAREQARRLLLEARKEVDAAIVEVREADRKDRETAALSARRQVEDAARRHRPPTSTAIPVVGRSSSHALAAGDRVCLARTGAWGVVQEIEDERVTVEVRGMRLRVRPEELGRPGQAQAPGPETSPTPSAAWGTLDLPTRHEVDLRGLRVAEVEHELARALDGAHVAGLGELRIIHGKGSGAVAGRVRELLESDERIEGFRPGREGEGGSGVTTAVFR